jgi:hypothetical protein
MAEFLQEWDRPKPFNGETVSSDFFRVLVFPPALGRDLIPEDVSSGGECEACLNAIVEPAFRSSLRLRLLPANVLSSFRPVQECFCADLGHGLALLICVNIGQTVEQGFCF